MNTPICDFVRDYAESASLRLHMPGHKGAELLGIEKYDITEIAGADVLYDAKGIIAESERNAESLFGTRKTIYSTEGSSLSIRAMLYLASLYGKSRGLDPMVLAGRNAHRVFHSAAALLDLDVCWLGGESDTLTTCSVTPEGLEKALCESSRRPFAVYITSPDYLGNILDVEGISRVAEEHGILCLVDNAHGAYLHFLPSSAHPIDLGAHICADSAHKTLPALTGAGYLHISHKAPSMLCDESERAMALFASTSPSYIIMQSLDMVNAYLDNGYAERLSAFAERVAELCHRLSEKGYSLIGNEPLKVSIEAKSYGYLGDELAELVMAVGVIPEHYDRDVVVFMLTPEISDRELDFFESVLLGIERRAPIEEKAPTMGKRRSVTSIREAALGRKERISAKDSCGRILADLAVSCPPAVPVVVCGEVIDENAIELFEYYGIEEVSVVVE